MDAYTGMATILGVSSPYVVVFVLLTIGIWVFPFAEEIALITAGYLLYRGDVQWWVMVPVAGVGVFLGDAMLFWLGQRCNTFILARWFHPHRSLWALEQMSRAFDRYGVIALFCVRFLPGVRFPMHVAAGVSGMPVPTYVTISGLSIMFYVPLAVMLAYSFGEEIAEGLQALQHLGHATWVVLFLMTGFWLLLRPWIGARPAVRHQQVRDPIRPPLSKASLNTEQPKEAG